MAILRGCEERSDSTDSREAWERNPGQARDKEIWDAAWNAAWKSDVDREEAYKRWQRSQR